MGTTKFSGLQETEYGAKVPTLGIATASVTTFDSKYISLEGSAWDTDDTVARSVDFRFRTSPTSSTVVGGSIYLSFWRDGSEISSNLLNINSGGNLTVSGQVKSSSGIFTKNGTGGAALQGNDNSDGSAVGILLTNATTLDTAGDKLVSIDNAGTEKAYIDYQGTFQNDGGRILTITEVDSATHQFAQNERFLSVLYTDTGTVTMTVPTGLEIGTTYTIADSYGGAGTFKITINSGSDTFIETVDDSSTSFTMETNGQVVHMTKIASAKWKVY